jgi:hypothetical protein
VSRQSEKYAKPIKGILKGRKGKKRIERMASSSANARVILTVAETDEVDTPIATYVYSEPKTTNAAKDITGKRRVDVIAGPVSLGFPLLVFFGRVCRASLWIKLLCPVHVFDTNSMIDHKKVLISVIRSSHYYQGHRHQLDFQYPQFSPLCYMYSCLLDILIVLAVITSS